MFAVRKIIHAIYEKFLWLPHGNAQKSHACHKVSGLRLPYGKDYFALINFLNVNVCHWDD